VKSVNLAISKFKVENFRLLRLVALETADLSWHPRRARNGQPLQEKLQNIAPTPNRKTANSIQIAYLLSPKQ
jgi:hypothetical protein